MPNTFGLNRTLGGAIGVIALVSVLGSGTVLLTLDRLHETTEARRRVTLVARSLDAFRTAMLNQETGLRGYLITGRDSSLEPYRAGRPALDETIDRLKALTSNDPDTSRLLDDAVIAARTWQGQIGELAIRKAADPATRSEAVRIEAEGDGKQLFDTLRGKLAAIEIKQENARIALNERVAEAERTAVLTLWGAALLTLLICIGIGIAINRLIVRPLGRVMTFVEHVGEGDLTATLGAEDEEQGAEKH